MIEKCKKHPKYKAKRAPKTCKECWKYFILSKSKLRIPVAPPTKAFKNKKNYSRKEKHKKDIE